MTIFSPVLACHGGGINLGPALTLLLMGTAALWLFAIGVAIPNLWMIFRKGRSGRFIVINAGFFGTYLYLGLSLFVTTALHFDERSGVAMIVVFLAPTMAAGHFFYLVSKWRKERKAKQGNEKLRAIKMPEAGAGSRD